MLNRSGPFLLFRKWRGVHLVSVSESGYDKVEENQPNKNGSHDACRAPVLAGERTGVTGTLTP
jgi:hypothetical protein